ncbi:MAG TPA: RtcB family protein [bacterium]
MGEIKIKKINDFKWEIPREKKMKVPGIIYADEKMLNEIRKDESLRQVVNVAKLPGIVSASLAMPDIHAGYGFPIGGIAAFDASTGIISPGGVGYDINCGVRLLRTDLERKEIEPHIEKLVDAAFRNVPSGVGSHRKDMRFSDADLKKVMLNGAREIIRIGFGFNEDAERIEEGGVCEGAIPDYVSKRAMDRGRDQLGTLGSGNHFIEIGFVEEIYDEKLASALGLFKNGMTVLVHTGSRGFGYQICDDYLRELQNYPQSHGEELPDRQLVWAHINSQNGQRYLGAMTAAINFAFANRQLITHWVRESFEQIFGKKPVQLGIRVVYDVAHNIAKKEKHLVEGKEMKLIVHRKGATRAFPAGRKELPAVYRDIGQPVLIPGDMGRYSYVLIGTPRTMEETFGTVCHGAGRVMSRHEAIRRSKDRQVIQELRSKGIIVRGATRATINEEIPEAYKDVSRVVDIVAGAGLAKKVAKLRPLGVVKG